MHGIFVKQVVPQSIIYVASIVNLWDLHTYMVAT